MDYRLLESAPDAMVIVDAAGQIVFVNARAEHLLGYGREELLQRPVEILIPARYRAGHVAQRVAYAEYAHPRPMGSGLELRALRKDGAEVPVEISLSPLETDDGMFVVTAIRDITERKRVEADRARLIEEQTAQRQADRLKDEFLATVSHELRTPLNAILGWATMLRAGSLDPARAAHALEAIERNARVQARLVEDLLDLSRVVTGKLQLELGPVDVVELINAAIDVVRPSAQAKRIEIALAADERPVPLLADADRLQQAIWNILTNAIKFTPPKGRVDVQIRSGTSSVAIVVRDSGRGIDPSFVPHVFDRFRQEDSRSTRSVGGLGLGLSIVRAIVEAHGGSVAAFSAGLNAGSTFTLELPSLDAGAVDREHASPSAGSANPLTGVRVLVVDDVADDRELLTTILEQGGAMVAAADTVRSALALIESVRPDVLVSDIAMPGEDGYTLLRHVRQHGNPLVANTPAVALTAYARSEDARRATAAGFNRFISKPVDPEDLVSAVSIAAGQPAGKPQVLLG
jgi:PAS domain S-box-containing protein